MSYAYKYLQDRLVDVERATTYLTLVLTQPDSVFKNDELLRNQLTTLLSETTAIRRKMSGLVDTTKNPEDL